MLDIKIMAIVSVLILLILGYFVYVLYQDVVFLRKDVQEIKGNSWEFMEETGEEEEEETEEDEDYEGDEEYHNHEDEMLENHLNTFLNQPSMPTIAELPEPVQEQEVFPEAELVPEIQEKTTKKRKTKAK